MNKYIKLILASALLLVAAGVLFLFSGKFFIREVVQDVDIPDISGLPQKAIVDSKAPAFTMPDLGGNKAGLSDFIGQPLVITFWASWNQASADQIKIFDEYLSRSSRNLFTIVTVNTQEDVEVVRNFMRRGGYRVLVLLDEVGEAGELYQARNLPTSFFIDKKGIIRDIFIGVLSEKMLVEKIEKVIQ